MSATDDDWPADASEARTAEVRPRARAQDDEGRPERLRKAASASGELQALALLEVSAAIDRLTRAISDRS